ncbi:ABC transporter permease subunit [Propionibacteriaceae bacterium G1746]|uniref:ABC transporter permease subunit n=1 Tax=Aestuariimicrobium sp. G57 TaxID=3418485 RepID=UPI003C1A3376
MSTSLEEREARGTRARATYSTSLWAWVVKILLLGSVAALCLTAALIAASKQSWLVMAAFIAIAIVAMVVYLPPNRFLPAKYLTPGLIFLLVFTVGAMAYTIWVGFTNYGDGHNSSKKDAINSIIQTNQARVPDTPTLPSTVVEKDGALWLAVVVDEGGTKVVKVGKNDTPVSTVDGAELTSLGAIRALPGYRVLPFAEISQRSADVSALQVPLTDKPEDGYYRTTTGSQAFVYNSTITYDAAADTFTNPDGVVYRDNGNGNYAADDGTVIEPGWRVGVGFDNFKSAFTNPDIRGPFISVTAWTFAFALLSVATTFVLGLFLAIVLNDPGMAGQKVYRTLLILPYAFPAFLSALIFAGLFNQEFGFINQVILGGANIPWLLDPWWAKAALLITNLWLGYPYMFLVATGALQSIPEDILEAAKVDGASPWRTFMSIKLPLLMVPLAPLLISSFAFNFNNFTLVFLLTKGWPQFEGTSLNVGHTDILISMVYKLAGLDGTARHDYGLASAFSILIFIIVGVVSYLGFRQTKTLENLN